MPESGIWVYDTFENNLWNQNVQFWNIKDGDSVTIDQSINARHGRQLWWNGADKNNAGKTTTLLISKATPI